MGREARANKGRRFMKYEIRFTTDDGDRFKELHRVFFTGSANAGERKTEDVLRREIAVMDALKSVSTVEQGLPDDTDGAPRTLNAGEQFFTLDQPMYQLVLKMIDATIAVTTAIGARKIIALKDWFSSIKPVDPSKEAQ